VHEEKIRERNKTNIGQHSRKDKEKDGEGKESMGNSYIT
jgi:hypothetical protein